MLLAQGSTAVAPERYPHTIGRWAAALEEGGPAALISERPGGPPALGETHQAELRAAVRESPAEAGIGLADWKVVHQFVRERRSVSLSRSSYLNYLRLGFAFKRPKNRLLKADERNREPFVAEYADVGDGARNAGAKTFFADEALI